MAAAVTVETRESNPKTKHRQASIRLVREERVNAASSKTAEGLFINASEMQTLTLAVWKQLVNTGMIPIPRHVNYAPYDGLSQNQISPRKQHSFGGCKK